MEKKNAWAHWVQDHTERDGRKVHPIPTSLLRGMEDVVCDCHSHHTRFPFPLWQLQICFYLLTVANQHPFFLFEKKLFCLPPRGDPVPLPTRQATATSSSTHNSLRAWRIPVSSASSCTRCCRARPRGDSTMTLCTACLRWALTTHVASISSST